VPDIYEHYRSRAVIKELHDEGKQSWDGYLTTDDTWLSYDLAHKTDLSDYMCGFTGPSTIKSASVSTEGVSMKKKTVPKKAAGKKAPAKKKVKKTVTKNSKEESSGKMMFSDKNTDYKFC
jgi:hypothetical protein